MSTRSDAPAFSLPGSGRRRALTAGLALLLVATMIYDTRIVRIGSEDDVRAQVFSPEAFGAAEFPAIKSDVEQRAVEAAILAAAIAEDKAAASAQYGVPAGIGHVFPVAFTGIVGEGKSGVYQVAVPGLPSEVGIRVQTGPAVNGTDLRDATGRIEFGHFTNQIEYQDAGSALNTEMKKDVLANFDNSALTGKTIAVVGVFTLVNPKNWLVTPVRIDLE